MRKLLLPACSLALLAALVACGAAPTPTAVPAAPTATPPAMASKLVLYGDLALFDKQENPDNCILKSRYKRGEGVGFRMTALDPLSGKVAETAELVVHLSYGGKTVDVPMRWRGTGNNPRPWLWTAKWAVPDDAPVGVVKYTVTASDKEGRTGEFKPFEIEPSQLTVVQ